MLSEDLPCGRQLILHLLKVSPTCWGDTKCQGAVSMEAWAFTVCRGYGRGLRAELRQVLRSWVGVQGKTFGVPRCGRVGGYTGTLAGKTAQPQSLPLVLLLCFLDVTPWFRCSLRPGTQFRAGLEKESL